jgi:hypothetical protein
MPLTVLQQLPRGARGRANGPCPPKEKKPNNKRGRLQQEYWLTVDDWYHLHNRTQAAKVRVLESCYSRSKIAQAQAQTMKLENYNQIKSQLRGSFNRKNKLCNNICNLTKVSFFSPAVGK